MSWNVQGGLKHRIKRELVIEEIVNNKADIIAIQEPGDLSAEEIGEIRILMTRKWNTVKVIYQKTGSKYGGVMTILRGTWVHRYHAHEHDTRRLNRFNITRIRGKGGKIISIINVYRPHFRSTGPNSVAEECRRYVDRNGIDGIEPETMWENDLMEILSKEDRESIIITGDFNKRINERIRAWTTLDNLEMYNVLQWKYNGEAPPTRLPGERGAIDHIVCSKQMKALDANILQPTMLSDHVPIKATILGNEWFYYIYPKSTIGNRKLSTNNPRAVKKFREILEKKLKHNEIRERLDNLTVRMSSEKKQDYKDNVEFSKIVELVDKLTIEAEDKAIGSTNGQRNLSKQERKIRQEILGWNKIVSWCRNRNNQTRFTKIRIKGILRTLGKKECEVNSIDIAEAKEGLKKAWEKWKAREETKWRMRNEWRYYEEAKGKQALGDAREVEAIIEALRHQNETKRRHKRIKLARGKSHGEGLTILEVEKENGEKMQVYQKDQIEQIAIGECYKKVHTADTTTLWNDQIAEWIRMKGGPEEWRNLFQTKKKIDEIETLPISNGAKHFLKEISQPTQAIDLKYDEEQYWNGWKKQRETTSSFGKITFSHFKCVTKDSLANSIRAKISNMRLRFGITPKVYKEATDVLLLKQPNDYRPHRMRLITLQHAASNHDFKLIGKRISEIGEEKGYFSECQYGSRKNKSAAIQALNKCLTLDISRIRRQTLTLIANDAKSCYDRVILWVLYFTMKKFGMSHQIAKTAVETIKDMVHSVSTVHGQSEITYGGEGSEPNGLLQGNGFAAQIWAAISSILFKIYEEQGYGAEIISPITKKTMIVAGFAFVDDTDLVDIVRANETEEDLIKRTQDGINLWNELIEVTGGALEPRKTDWCIISYKKECGVWIPCTRQTKVMIQDELSKEKIELKKLQPWEARRTLGIWQACDGNQRKQTEVLIENINKYGDQIKKSGLSTREKEIALRTTITRTIAYGAQATTLNAEQAEEVNKALRKATIQGLGIARSTAAAIIHGPKSRNGLEIIDYYTYQLIEHIKILIDHLGTKSRSGKLLETVIEEHTLELGMEGDLWEIKHPRYLYMLSNTWVKNTIDAMLRHEIRIEPPTGLRLKKWRIGDRMLMEMIINSPGNKMTLDQLKDVQEVRRHLQVINISDILVNGRIDKNTWEGIETISSISKSKYKWMKTVKPTQKEIKNWQQALTMIGISAPRIHVTNTLGSWFTDAISDKAWIDKDKEIIQIENEGGNKWYKKCYIRRNSDYYGHFRETTEVQKMVIDKPVRIVKIREKELLLLEEVQGYTDRQEEGIKQMCHVTEIEASVGQRKAFAEKMKQGTAILVADASDDKEGNLVAAFSEEQSWEEENNRRDIRGWAQIPAKSEDADSYRGELGGLLIAVRFINQLAEEYSVETGQCTIKSDNAEAVNIAQKLKTSEYPKSTAASFDLLRILQKEIKNTEVNFAFAWVRGHQDRDKLYEELENGARANCRADALAAKMIKGKRNVESPRMDREEGPSLWVKNKKIHSKLYRNILDHIKGQELDQYWWKKGRYKREMTDKIDWKALEGATKKLRFTDQVILTKLLANIAPTAETMYKRGEYIDDLCLLCKKKRETTRHVFQCKEAEMEVSFNKLFAKMKANLCKIKTIDAKALDAILGTIAAIREERNSKHWETISRDQSQIGEQAIFDGIIHKDLRKIVGGELGTQKVVREIFMIRLQMWKHRCHLVNEREHNKKRREKLDQEYDEAIRQKPRVMETMDSCRYNISKDTFRYFTIKDKEKWIEAMRNIRKKYKRLERKGLLRYWPQKTPEETEMTTKQTRRYTAKRKSQESTTIRKKRVLQPTLDQWMNENDRKYCKVIKRQKRATRKRTREITQHAKELTEEGKNERKRRKTGKITWWLNKQSDPGE